MPHLLTIVRTVLDMEIFDDPERCQLTAPELGIQALSVLAFRNERGLVSTPDLISAADQHPAAASTLAPKVALMLAAGSVPDLAAVIHELYERDRVLTAARLGIVLARLSGDRTRLERPRAILEEIGDWRFLRRATDVAASL